MEPIAVVGLAVRFPQEATSPDQFWKLISEGRNAMTEVPPDRFNVNGFCHPNGDALSTRGGHFIKGDIGAFDAKFFSINASEAAAMDPTQRILLETSYHAFENAGLSLQHLRGSSTSVHTGCFSNDYLRHNLSDKNTTPMYGGLNATFSMLANRLSWFYDLRGPSVNMDSACSSSSMAIDLACQLLRIGETKMALVAGCNLMFDPDYFKLLERLHFLSPDSRSFAFDQRANGYGRGEGFGVLILKRLSDALEDNDTIRCLIRASGSNSDGRTTSITQPNVHAQTQLIRDTYRKASISMEETRFFEAHGTGTTLGDATEASAIEAAFRHIRTTADPLYIGATKSNIGHLEGGAGIAGMIKTILVLEKGIITPNANFHELNFNIDSIDSALCFPTRCLSWPSSKTGIRRASLSSFGYGGSNCHIVIDDARSYLELNGIKGHHMTSPNSISSRSPAEDDHSLSYTATNGEMNVSTPRILVWSADNSQALTSIIELWERYCSRKRLNDNLLQDLAYTLAKRRSLLHWRCYAVVTHPNQLTTLSSISSQPRTRQAKVPRVAFVFTGQGAQWQGMGSELFQYPIFRDVIREADRELSRLGCTWSVEQQILLDRSSEESRIHEPDIAQPLCAILQIGIIELLAKSNVVPVVVVGHSMGEIAAAYCSRAISRKAAFRLAYYRGFFVAQVPRRTEGLGGMAAIGLSSTDVQPFIDRALERTERPTIGLAVCCINSPKNVTVSGDTAALEQLRVDLPRHVFFRTLKVSAAYHSPQLQCIKEDCINCFGEIDLETCSRRPYIPMVSTVTGQAVTADELRNPNYWVTNMISPVRFSEAIVTIAKDDEKSLTKKLDLKHQRAIVVDHIIEIGPHSTLQQPIRETLEHLSSKDMKYSSVLSRQRDASETFSTLLGELFCLGFPVEFEGLSGLECKTTAAKYRPMNIGDGPSYNFDHSKSYWFESPAGRIYRFREQNPLPLLGTRVYDWNPSKPQWQGYLRVQDLPWLEDHRIDQNIVYPASAFLVSVILGARQMLHSTVVTGYCLHDVRFKSAIVFTHATDEKEVMVSFNAYAKNVWAFVVCCRIEDKWLESCIGTVQVESAGGPASRNKISSLYSQELERVREKCEFPVPDLDLYSGLETYGFNYGTSFRNLTSIMCSSEGAAIANVRNEPIKGTDHLVEEPVLHPASLDAVMHLVLVVLTRGASQQGSLQLPTIIKRLWISAEAHEQTRLNALAKVLSQTPLQTSSSIMATSSDSKNVHIILDELITTNISTSAPKSDAQISNHYFQIQEYLDVQMMTKPEVSAWLHEKCGPTQTCREPRRFFDDLDLFLRSKLGEARRLNLRFEEKSHLKRYLAWAESLSSSLPLEVLDPNRISAIERNLQTSKIGQFYLHTGMRIQEVLSGSLTSQQLIFENDLIEGYYDEVLRESGFAVRAARYISQLAFMNPKMKILEVGAGTGSLTRIVMDSLTGSGKHSARCDNYYFTDISPVFFDKAKTEFAKLAPNMIFSTLDINHSFESQGYQFGTMDLIMAANSIHTANDLARALQEISKLLKPGGRFIFVESTVPSHIEFGAIFGLLPDWWTSTEEYRSMGPMVSTKRWSELLSSTGFQGLDFEWKDYTDDDSHHMSILGARSRHQTVPGANDDRILVVHKPGSKVQVKIANALCSSLSSCGYNFIEVRTVAEALQVEQMPYVVSLLDMEEPFLPDLSEESYNDLKRLLLRAQKVLWVSDGGSAKALPGYGMIEGLIAVLRIEQPQLILSTIALDSCNLPTDLRIRHITQVFTKLCHSANNTEKDLNYVEINGKLGVRRALDYLDLSAQVHGTLSGETIIQSGVALARPFSISTRQSVGNSDWPFRISKLETLSGRLERGKIEIEVYAAALDAKDLQSIDRPEPKFHPYYEGAGKISASGEGTPFKPGDRVCFAAEGTLQSTLQLDFRMCSCIPADMPFSEAASLPIDYLCMFQIVHRLAKLRSGSTVLVRQGTLPLTKALLDITLATMAKVYIVPESHESEALLKTIYHGRWCCFLSDTFYYNELRFHEPGGVDAIIDLASKPVPLDLYALAVIGGEIYRFTYGPVADEPETHVCIPTGVSFCNLSRANLIRGGIDQIEISLDVCLSSRKTFSLPMDETPDCFNLSDLETAADALRKLKDGRKVVIKIEDSDGIKLVRRPVSEEIFQSDATYLVAGGLGFVGCSVAVWLGQRGARNLIILSRSGPQSEKSRQTIQDLKALGVRVATPKCDIADYDQLEKTLTEFASWPEIKGCIHTAGKLQDLMYERMDWDSWKVAVNPKVKGSWNLHNILPSGLEFFIMMSSLNGIIGQATQINYAAGNAYQDALARYRVAHGERAVSLDLGVLWDRGMRPDVQTRLDRFQDSKIYPIISESELLAILELYCHLSPERDLSKRFQALIGVPNIRAQGSEIMEGMQTPLWSLLRADQRAFNDREAGGPVSGSVEFIATLKSAESDKSAGEKSVSLIMERLAHVLSAPIETLTSDKTFHTMGMDSLSAIEIRNWILKSFSIDIPVFDLLSDRTVDDIGLQVAKEVRNG